jgi:hypothetical protein
MGMFRGAWGTAPWGNADWGGVPNKLLDGMWGTAPWGAAPWGGRARPICSGGYGNEQWGFAPWGGKTYDDFKNEESRKPCTKMVIVPDFCTRSFGEQPCTATGTPCYNTYFTCKDKFAYERGSKEYTFVSGGSQPFRTGERPYLLSATYLPTEIKDNLTIGGRVKAMLADEPDGDVGVDPYLSQRSSVQGTFWKKFHARNPNLEKRYAYFYEGFEGLAESGFQLRFVGAIENVDNSDWKQSFEVVDLLRALKDVKIPAKIDVKLLNDITVSQTEFVCESLEGLPAADGLIKIGDEIVHYDGLIPDQNMIVNITRGYLNTAPAATAAGAKISLIKYYPLTNMFDRILALLQEEGGIEKERIDLEAFSFWRDMPGGEPDVDAVIVDEETVETLVFELADLADCKIWQNEQQKITIRRNLPNIPGRTYKFLSDSANFIKDSVKVNQNKGSRLTRAYAFWDRRALLTTGTEQQYMRREIAVDVEAESNNGYSVSKEKFYPLRWFSFLNQQEETVSNYLHATMVRRVWRQKDPLPILTADVGMKDSDVLTGDFVKVTTNAIQDSAGNPLSRGTFEIIKRDPKDKAITLTLLRVCPRKVAFWAPEGLPEYASATDADKEYGYFCNERGVMDNEDGPYCFW